MWRGGGKGRGKPSKKEKRACPVAIFASAREFWQTNDDRWFDSVFERIEVINYNMVWKYLNEYSYTVLWWLWHKPFQNSFYTISVNVWEEDAQAPQKQTCLCRTFVWLILPSEFALSFVQYVQFFITQ